MTEKDFRDDENEMTSDTEIEEEIKAHPAERDEPSTDVDDTPSEEKEKDEEEEVLTETEAYEEEIANKFEELVELLNTKQYALFRRELKELNPVDTADFFDKVPPELIPRVFRLIEKDTAADVFAELDPDLREKIILALTDREISFIIEDMYLDDAAETVSELPASIVKRVMKNATPETRNAINRLLSYPPDSAGSVMTAEYIHLHSDMTCAQAIEHIRKTGMDKETVYVAYVVDSARVLIGTVALRKLLFASPTDTIENIMDENVICASTLDDREDVAAVIAKYHFLALPIVDGEHRLVGIVTVDDAIEVMETEVTEDIEKMAAIVPSDKPYLKTGVFETWKKRIPWLLLLMISATFTSSILASFETALSACAALTLFIPMLMSTGGNAGEQTSVTVIRSLSLGEVEPRIAYKVLWKEFRVSVVCGITVAVACFIKLMLVDFRLDFSQSNMLVALVVCLTIFAAIVVAKAVGSLLPLGAKLLKLDPAVMASPFITTIVDAIVLLVYFAIASRILGI